MSQKYHNFQRWKERYRERLFAPDSQGNLKDFDQATIDHMWAAWQASLPLPQRAGGWQWRGAITDHKLQITDDKLQITDDKLQITDDKSWKPEDK